MHRVIEPESSLYICKDVGGKPSRAGLIQFEFHSFHGKQEFFQSSWGRKLIDFGF